MTSSFDFDNDPELLLTQAAAAARTMIEHQEQRLIGLEAEVEKTKHTIARLSQLAGLDEPQAQIVRPIRRRARFEGIIARAAAADAADADAEEQRAEATASSDVEYEMMSAPLPVTVAELRERIQMVHGRTWAESTIYARLGKGKAEGRYMNENNRWAMAKSKDDEL